MAVISGRPGARGTGRDGNPATWKRGCRRAKGRRRAAGARTTRILRVPLFFRYFFRAFRFSGNSSEGSKSGGKGRESNFRHIHIINTHHHHYHLLWSRVHYFIQSTSIIPDECAAVAIATYSLFPSRSQEPVIHNYSDSRCINRSTTRTMNRGKFDVRRRQWQRDA